MTWTPDERTAAHRRAEAAFIGVAQWNEAVHADCKARGLLPDLHDVAEAMLTFTASLLAARGGTMTAERLADLRDSIAALAQKHPAISEEIHEALKHIASQGAKVATLETEAAALREEGGRYETFMKFEHASKGALLKELFTLKEQASERGLYDLRDALFKAEGERDEVVADLADLTELLCGERPHGVMAETTKDAARKLRAELEEARAERRRLSELAQVTTAMGLRRELEEARTALATMRADYEHVRGFASGMERRASAAVSELFRLTSNPPTSSESSGAKCLTCHKPLESAAVTIGGCCSRTCYASRPSGQVADDVETLQLSWWDACEEDCDGATHTDTCEAWGYEQALSRLAALARRTVDAEAARDAYRDSLIEAAHFEMEWAFKDGNSPGYNNQKARNYGRIAYEQRVRADAAESQLNAFRARIAEAADERDEFPVAVASDERKAGWHAAVAFIAGDEDLPTPTAGALFHPPPAAPTAKPSDHKHEWVSSAVGTLVYTGCDERRSITESGEEQASSAFAEGAEAMRAACWEAVQAVIRQYGWDQATEVGRALKAAIEGAVP